MRKDLNKLLCEHERWGSSNSFKDVRHMNQLSFSNGADEEDLPAREGIKKRYRIKGNDKSFGDNLNALYGFVRKNLGKQWNDVYSIVCRQYRMSTVINTHILEHLEQIVKTQVFIKDGVMYYNDNYRSGPRTMDDWGAPDYFVHPETGILSKNHLAKPYQQRDRERKAEAEAEKAKWVRKIDANKELRKRKSDGIWFVCELEKLPRQVVSRVREEDGTISTVVTGQDGAYDLWYKRSLDNYGNFVHEFGNRTQRDLDYYSPGKYVKAMWTASHKVLKQNGLA
jgi:hypothetical protein